MKTPRPYQPAAVHTPALTLMFKTLPSDAHRFVYAHVFLAPKPVSYTDLLDVGMGRVYQLSPTDIRAAVSDLVDDATLTVTEDLHLRVTGGGTPTAPPVPTTNHAAGFLNFVRDLRRGAPTEGQ